ncbi:DNA internalization-related competence protein ComEC/Rec2 [Marinobacter zhanjiangensis]|uniref:DNA internalization-related competence protein ComEC/Rec2 n=1 Tax=Marinobacter zhanjiangensis TaxID=578215 RepID=A0ABQ3BAE3_9GAMM|nr:DNA internalization-related competence protein ComEC/Rec2 [Marinobacter zhanjiangensis]GGY84982.1 DNA internalization-related competence protein ComEC/Rec2 [Marinobacter zhanjiangensis]
MGARIAAFACGVIILYSGLFTPPRALVVSVAGVTLLGALLAGHRAGRWRGGAGLAICLFVGLACAALVSQQRLDDRLSPALEGDQLTVSGYLCDTPSPGAWDSVRFSLCLDDRRPAGVPRRLRLAWYGDEATLSLPSPMTATVVLKRPHGAVNPGGFRYETWLFRQGYGATGSVRSVTARPGDGCGLPCRYHRWRQGLVLAGHDSLDSMEYTGLALSLLLGYRGELSNRHWQVLEATGTIHLVAISGLHLGLVATLAAVVLRWLALRLPRREPQPRRLRAVLWLGVATVALSYALLAGFTVPTRRALVMVVVAGWLLLVGRLSTTWHGWLLALGAVLLLDPVSPLDQGFWLSFCAVAVLILVFSRRQGQPGALRALVLAQAAVFAGLWPVLSVLDQGAAWAGLVANILAIPWLSLVVMPVLMIGGLILLVTAGQAGAWVGVLFDGVLGALWWVLENLAAVGLPAGRVPVFLAVAVACVVLAALWVPDRRFRWSAVLVVALMLVGAGIPKGNRWQEAPQVWVWDVGQGLSVLVRHRDETLIYDTGPESASGYNAVSDVLIPSFDRLGVRSLDTLVLSHGDQDHAGGLSVLFRRYSPERIISGEPARLQEATGGRAVVSCQRHGPVPVGEVAVSFWQAEPAVTDDANDRSCVMLIRYGRQQILLPGDISRRTEQEMLRGWPVMTSEHHDLTLIAPHHGSKTSSGEAFVARLAPQKVIFTAGYRHRYGHPHPDVVARYRAVGSSLLNTATSGALRLDLRPGRVDVVRWREGAPFWIRGPEPAGSE